MDYRNLLLKYIGHVLDRESIDYIDQIGATSDGWKFTDEEVAVLECISEEVRK